MDVSGCADDNERSIKAMRRFIGLYVAVIAVAVPTGAVAASALGSASPADSHPECDGYQYATADFGPLITNEKALFGPMEKAFCGERSTN
jgi:hypothetical protein